VKGTPNSVTSSALLVRLQQTPVDQAAWAEFVERYGDQIHGWCRQWGLQVADAQDITQTVMLKLLQSVRTVRYDQAQKFHAWLKTVTHHAWQDLIRSRRQVAVGGHRANDPLQRLAARDDLVARLESVYRQGLLESALDRVRPRVQSKTWNAFCLTSLERLPGAAAAARLGMPLLSVYKARSNVRKLLEAEVRYLEGGRYELRPATPSRVRL
jgi:RNA polymerase sigma-70 factor (ECF subfamily)